MLDRVQRGDVPAAAAGEPPAVPAALEAVCLKAMALAPGRPLPVGPGPGRGRRALAGGRAGDRVTASRGGPGRGGGPRRHRTAVAAGLVLAVATVIASTVGAVLVLARERADGRTEGPRRGELPTRPRPERRGDRPGRRQRGPVRGRPRPPQSPEGPANRGGQSAPEAPGTGRGSGRPSPGGPGVPVRGQRPPDRARTRGGGGLVRRRGDVIGGAGGGVPGPGGLYGAAVGDAAGPAKVQSASAAWPPRSPGPTSTGWSLWRTPPWRPTRPTPRTAGPWRPDCSPARPPSTRAGGKYTEAGADAQRAAGLFEGLSGKPTEAHPYDPLLRAAAVNVLALMEREEGRLKKAAEFHGEAVRLINPWSVSPAGAEPGGRPALPAALPAEAGADLGDRQCASRSREEGGSGGPLVGQRGKELRRPGRSMEATGGRSRGGRGLPAGAGVVAARTRPGARTGRSSCRSPGRLRCGPEVLEAEVVRSPDVPAVPAGPSAGHTPAWVVWPGPTAMGRPPPNGSSKRSRHSRTA